MTMTAAPISHDVPEDAVRRATLCITTYLRPVGLRSALAAVRAMRVPEDWDLEILVIDNDGAGSAEHVVAEATAAGMQVRYVIEPTRGIPQVRNRAVTESVDREWLLFLDDDEAPSADWLERLDAAQRATAADVAIGPSVPAFEHEPPRWISEGGFFERRRFQTGEVIPFWCARSSGVLIRTTSFAHLGARPFDDGLALTGGTDRHFFSAIEQGGGRIVWADDAVVVETVPASRATLTWLLRRAFRTGNSRSTGLVRQERAGVARRAKRVGRGVVDIVRGLTVAALGRGGARRVVGLQLAANGVGLVLGALGYRYEEYRTVHGV